MTLDILVEALGRVNFGCVWDFKGLTSPDVRLNGTRLPDHLSCWQGGPASKICCIWRAVRSRGRDERLCLCTVQAKC